MLSMGQGARQMGLPVKLAASDMSCVMGQPVCLSFSVRLAGCGDLCSPHPNPTVPHLCCQSAIQTFVALIQDQQVFLELCLRMHSNWALCLSYPTGLSCTLHADAHELGIDPRLCCQWLPTSLLTSAAARQFVCCSSAIGLTGCSDLCCPQANQQVYPAC